MNLSYVMSNNKSSNNKSSNNTSSNNTSSNNTIIYISRKEKNWLKIVRQELLNYIKFIWKNPLNKQDYCFYSSSWNNPAVIEFYSYLNQYKSYDKFPYKLCSWLIHQKRKLTLEIHYDKLNIKRKFQVYRDIKEIDICLQRIQYIEYTNQDNLYNQCYHCKKLTSNKIYNVLNCCYSCESNFWSWIEFYKCWKLRRNGVLKFLCKDVVLYILKKKILE